MNQSHHDEQMQAARVEFEKLWADKLLPRVKSFGVKTANETWFCYEAAWIAFRAGQQTNKNTNTP